MTLRHLSIFTAVADALSMTEAAKRLFVAQPTVSQSVAELERDLGTKLFERIGGKLYLTGDGENFLAYARHVTSLIDDAVKKVAKGGRLRAASTLTVATPYTSRSTCHRLNNLPRMPSLQAQWAVAVCAAPAFTLKKSSVATPKTRTSAS